MVMVHLYLVHCDHIGSLLNWNRDFVYAGTVLSVKYKVQTSVCGILRVKKISYEPSRAPRYLWITVSISASVGVCREGNKRKTDE